MRLFLAVAFGLSWLFVLPAWLTGGQGSPWFLPGLTAMMFTPALGVLAVWARERTPFRQWARDNGLTLGPRRARTLGVMAATWLAVPAIVGLALALSAALGLVALDLDGFSLFRQGLSAKGVEAPAALGPLVVTQILVAVLLAPVLNVLPMLGEELGWRGWLQPRLVAARGVFPGLMLGGVIWGLWHAPATLLGYNYPAFGPWAAPYFVIACVALGVAIGWLRLRTGSVWPAVVAHGSFNATAGAVLLLGDVAAPPDTTVAGVTGPVGWALLAGLAFALFRLFPVRSPAASAPSEPAAPARSEPSA
ncbi:CPBP family intramembrane glutamic endopeptidase [Nonomuraea longicatena]|uniref:CPBP family intramembrane metalloprotease n=1 Tax=Nonomuraea longicatena TaxID=83682 RepID=A0ABP4A6T7_9ACTN